MYGLKQAAILAYDHLVKNLGNYGYYPIPHTVGLWKHKMRRISFCLCVDDFGVKYLIQTTPTIYSPPCNNTTKFPPIGRELNSVAFTSLGIMKINTSIYPCRIIYPPY